MGPSSCTDCTVIGGDGESVVGPRLECPPHPEIIRCRNANSHDTGPHAAGASILFRPIPAQEQSRHARRPRPGLGGPMLPMFDAPPRIPSTRSLPRRQPLPRRNPRTARTLLRREGQGPRHPRRHPHPEGRRAGAAARATDDERQTLARFGGFGPVALSIFPDPVTGRYKDGWQAIGEELKSLLTPEEYDSAKRTTFNAFYTSPVVIAAMHEALVAPRRPRRRAPCSSPDAASGNFMAQAPAERVHRRRAGLASPAGSPGPPPAGRHPHRELPRHQAARPLDAVIGNVPFADVKLDHHGQKFSLHDYFFAKSVDALKPGGVLALVTTHLHARQAERGRSASTSPTGPTSSGRSACRPTPSSGRARRSSPTSCSCGSELRARKPNHADPEWLETSMIGIDGADLPVNRYFLVSVR